MRRIFLLALLLGTHYLLLASEKPDIVPSKITELKPKAWYAQVSGHWQTYLETHPDDVKGWLSYLRALQYAGDEKTLAESSRELTSNFPDSFLDHYATFQNKGWNEEGLIALKRALDKPHERILTLEDELILSELSGKRQGDLSHQIYREGLVLPSTLSYNYNLLMSVSEGGVLVTEGLHSTVPLWVLQDVMGVRADVEVLNLQLIQQFDDYFSNKVQSMRMELEVPHDLFETETGLEVYYALTLPRERLKSIENRLYVVGLASTQAEDDFAHFEVLRANVEEKFLMDYLSIDFNGEPKTATGKVLSSNYIVPLVLLKGFYDQAGDSRQSAKLKKSILALASSSPMKRRVTRLLDEEKEIEPLSYVKTELDVRTLEKNLRQVKDNIYASSTELTNKEYWAYLDYLRSNNYTDLYHQALQDRSKYDDLTATMLSNFYYSPANVEMSEKHEKHTFLRYPALDMSYEAAVAYCEWLTYQYHEQPKRKYQKVIFRLPSKAEWQMAALGHKGFTSWTLEENQVLAHVNGNRKKAESFDLKQYTVDYPWGLFEWERRNSITNRHNCYLANVKAPEEVTCPAGIKGDGFTITSPTSTYFPNEMGLFDVIGNVAEMISEPGRAMGGSWNQEPEDCTITSVLDYGQSDIRVGFRLFMEVLEE